MLNSIKNKFGGAEGLQAVKKILPQDVIDKMASYRMAGNIKGYITSPLKVVSKLFGLASVVPMVLDVYDFSKDPKGYMFEKNTGKPKELLFNGRKAFEKSQKGEKLSNQEWEYLFELGVAI